MASLPIFSMGFRFLAGTAAFVFPSQFIHYAYGREEGIAKTTADWKLDADGNIPIRMFAVRDLALGYMLWESPSRAVLHKALVAAAISDIDDVLASVPGYQKGAISGLATSKATTMAAGLAALQLWAARRAMQ
ncbi:hypothetical protein TW65_07907 [Stemphylium lycopersici]|nr:hypothetical protein TW65_07907 [Stemphylium lycopersici]